MRFSEPGQTADDAIVAYLRERAEPGQYAVVTNDQELAARVRAAGASHFRASDFAPRLAQGGRWPLLGQAPEAEASVTPDPRAPGFADLYATFMDAEKSRVRAAGAGAEHGDATHGDAPHENAALWVERLYGDDIELAQRAALWLGRSGASQALAPLRDALTHQDVRVRAAALLALGSLGDPAALPDLCARLARDPGSMAREAAAQSLGRIGDRTVEPLLADVAVNDSKGKVRKAAQAALAQIRARRGGGRTV